MLKRTLLLLATLSVFQSGYAAQHIPVSSCADLQAMNVDLSAHYYLTQDIDCKGFYFSPVPGEFNGELTGKTNEGGRYTIRDLTISANPGQPGGLFEKTSQAIIDNLNFERVSVLSDDNTHRGLLAAEMLLTLVEHVAITDVLVGGNTTDDSAADDYLEGREGGLAGSASKSGVIDVQLKGVSIKQHTWAGGMFGEAYGVEIKRSSVSGLTAFSGGQRIAPYSDTAAFGGLIGYGASVVITESFAQGEVSSPDNAGGLIGIAAGVEITDSYAQVNVNSSNEYAGGLIGRSHLETTFDHVYAAGLVSARKYGRGMIGADNPQGDYITHVNEGYFDKDLAKKDNSGDSGSKGISTKRMTKEHNETFSASKGWNRDIWIFEDGQYPRLRGA